MTQIEVLDGPSTCMNLALVAMREAAGYVLPAAYEDLAVGERGDDGAGFVGFAVARFKVGALEALTTPTSLYNGCVRYGLGRTVNAVQRTRGALLFRLGDTVRPDQVAFCLGDGRTVELAGGVAGLGTSTPSRWTHAALVPQISYGRPL